MIGVVSFVGLYLLSIAGRSRAPGGALHPLSRVRILEQSPSSSFERDDSRLNTHTKLSRWYR